MSVAPSPLTNKGIDFEKYDELEVEIQGDNVPGVMSSTLHHQPLLRPLLDLVIPIPHSLLFCEPLC